MSASFPVRELRNAASLALVVGAALLLAGAARAQPSDHELFDGFPDAQISEFQREDGVNYRVVLGSLQRVRGQVTPEDSRRVRGRLTRVLYEVPSGFSGQDVIDFFVDQMHARGYQELFSCAGRACGSSEYWANDIFGNRILYGPVQNQFYLAMGAEPPGRFYVSAYVITRINRQLLTYLEIIEPENIASEAGVTPQSSPSPSPSPMLSQIQESGGAVVPGLGFTADDALESGADLNEIVELMARNPELRLHVVAHLQGDESLESLLTRSESRAEAVRQALIAAGADPSRLTARGLGPLAPLCSAEDCAERVELVGSGMP